jgi:hypothetical protein
LNNMHNIQITDTQVAYEFVLAVLNSRLITSFHQHVVPEVDRVFAEVKIVDLEQLPIPHIAFTTPAAERERLADKGRRLYEQFCQKNDYACVLGFVDHHLGGGERPDDNRPDAKASGYAHEGHEGGLQQIAREGGLVSGSPPIHGPGNNTVARGNNTVASGNINAGWDDHTVAPSYIAAEPPAHPVQPHAETPEHRATATEPHANTTELHANVRKHGAETAVHLANVTERHAESPVPHANVTEQQPIVAPAPDIVHDLLAFLAQQMIALHKQRQQRGEAFVLDLQGVLHAGAVDKLGRLWTPPKATDAAAVAEAQTVLGPLAQRRITLRDDIGALNEAQWKWLTKRRLKQVPNFAQVVQVFRDHQPTLAALDRRIAATDRLVDQIVYRLYGLTEAEVALVEGGAVTAPGVVPGSSPPGP